MADRGIKITYTERVQDLNLANLSKYDVLLVYANIDSIDAAEAKSLLDYVAGGGGFVPLHCASYCFRNNPNLSPSWGRNSYGTAPANSTQTSSLPTIQSCVASGPSERGTKPTSMIICTN